MSVTVKLNYVRHSARKLSPVIKMYRGKKLEQAINETSLMTQQSAYYLNKALKMAKAAATAKEFAVDKLVVTGIAATIGPKIKRVRPNARGRANAYKKHLAHLLVTVEEIAEPKSKKRNNKSAKETS